MGLRVAFPVTLRCEACGTCLGVPATVHLHILRPPDLEIDDTWSSNIATWRSAHRGKVLLHMHPTTPAWYTPGSLS